MSVTVDLVVKHAGELLTLSGGDGPLTGDDLGRLNAVADGALIAAGGTVEWVGPTSELAARLDGRTARREIDATGCVVMPGFVDCHTHIPFAGGREAEFEMRVEGRSYLEIAAAGGGILSSVRHFREASTEDLIRWNRARLEAMLAAGTTTVECKTGYGLSTEEELRGLAVIDALAGLGPWRLIPTFLGAHALPPEHRDHRARYLDLLVEETLPRVAEQGIARYCDIFIEEGVFTVEEGRRLMVAAREHGLVPKLHVDEFTALGGSALAAEVGAVSADHLEEIRDDEIDALGRAGVIGVLMPGVNYFLGNHAYAPARRMVERGVAIAIATDFNPGSCMCHSMELVLSLAATQLKLRPAEAIAAATRNAAFACGVGDTVGRLEPGFAADLVVMDVADPRTLAYHFGSSHVREVVVGGEILVGWR